MKSGWEHFSTLSEGFREGLWIVQARGSLRHFFFFHQPLGTLVTTLLVDPPSPAPLDHPS